jgi:DNA-binding MarR family transcriptional regulator
MSESALRPQTHPAAAQTSQQAGDALVDDATLRQTIELLFFAYRDFTGDADALLARWGFGRAHHRAIYFIGRHPGISVGELLAILRITKQSLARVLGQLMREGFVVQRIDPADRRRRRLFLTAEAQALERTLTDRQATRLAAASLHVGEAALEGFRAMLRAMIDGNGLPPSCGTR